MFDGCSQKGESRFDFYWRQQGEWVEEPNQRRGGESGVQRLNDANGKLLYAKRQVGISTAACCTLLAGDRIA